jgi:hypothetical protein
VDRRRFDVDPDTIIYFKADPYTDWDPTPSFTNGVKSETVLTFIQISDSLNCFIFLVSVIGVKIFQYFGSKLKISWIHFKKMVANPDPAPDTPK